MNKGKRDRQAWEDERTLIELIHRYEPNGVSLRTLRKHFRSWGRQRLTRRLQWITEGEWVVIGGDLVEITDAQLQKETRGPDTYYCIHLEERKAIQEQIDELQTSAKERGKIFPPGG